MQRALLRGSSKWRTASWVIPAFLWVIVIGMYNKLSTRIPLIYHTLVAGLIANLILWVKENITLCDIFEATALIANVFLNLYATFFISVRLFSHRRAVIACLGENALTTQHLCLMGIFLESAAINVPVTILVAVGIGMHHTFGVIISPVAFACQVSWATATQKKVQKLRYFSGFCICVDHPSGCYR